MPFPLVILTPEGRVFENTADSMTAPGAMGRFEALAGHAPMVAALEAGLLHVKTGETTEYFVIAGGVANVRPDSVTVLADSAVSAPSREQADDALAELKSAAPVD